MARPPGSRLMIQPDAWGTLVGSADRGWILQRFFAFLLFPFSPGTVAALGQTAPLGILKVSNALMVCAREVDKTVALSHGGENLTSIRAAMAITPQEIEKVALLARLLLTPEEVAAMAQQLGQVLDYMALLNEVDTTNVQPLAHAVEFANVFREDVVEPSLDREAALANAPHRDEECYLVPAVLGDV